MKSQLFAAVSLLHSFGHISTKPKEEIWIFRDKLIHLFSVLHACALGSISGSHHMHFPIIDISHVPTRFIEALHKCQPSERVELSYLWITNLVVREIPSGVLNVPPPILSRVFQEMETAMEHYNHILEIMSIPFPFPYSQACLMMFLPLLALMPVLIVSWTSQPLVAFLLTFLAASSFISLQLISSELENPFGDDPNDLPIAEFHTEFNRGLLMLLHPSLDDDFELTRYGFRDVGATKYWGELSTQPQQCDRDTDDADTDLNGRQASPAADSSNTEAHSLKPNVSLPHSLSVKGVQSAAAETIPHPGAEPELPKELLPEELQHLPQSGPSLAPCKPEMTGKIAESDPAELSWMAHFMQTQRKYEEDALERLDAIVQALKAQTAMVRQQTALFEGGSSDMKRENSETIQRLLQRLPL